MRNATTEQYREFSKKAHARRKKLAEMRCLRCLTLEELANMVHKPCTCGNPVIGGRK